MTVEPTSYSTFLTQVRPGRSPGCDHPDLTRTRVIPITGHLGRRISQFSTYAPEDRSFVEITDGEEREHHRQGGR